MSNLPQPRWWKSLSRDEIDDGPRINWWKWWKLMEIYSFVTPSEVRNPYQLGIEVSQFLESDLPGANSFGYFEACKSGANSFFPEPIPLELGSPTQKSTLFCWPKWLIAVNLMPNNFYYDRHKNRHSFVCQLLVTVAWGFKETKDTSK